MPPESESEITLNISTEGDRTDTIIVTRIPAGHCPSSVIFLQVSKDKSVFLIGYFRWKVGHTKH